MSDNALGKLPLKVIVPITDWKDHYEIAPWMIKIEPNNNNGLTKDSSADCFQIRSVSQDRFVKKIGVISDSIMEEIRIGLSKILSIDVEYMIVLAIPNNLIRKLSKACIGYSYL